MIVRDFYEEKGVVAKPNSRKNLTIWITGCLTVAGLVGMLWIPICLVFCLMTGVMFIMLFRERYIEYDYCFANEEIEVAKIMNRKRRKTAISFDVSNIRFIAPEGSVRLSNERERNPQMRFTDYTSLEPKDKVYGFVLEFRGIHTIILLEPTVTMMEHMKQLIPNKIYED